MKTFVIWKTLEIESTQINVIHCCRYNRLTFFAVIAGALFTGIFVCYSPISSMTSHTRIHETVTRCSSATGITEAIRVAGERESGIIFDDGQTYEEVNQLYMS